MKSSKPLSKVHAYPFNGLLLSLCIAPSLALADLTDSDNPVEHAQDDAYWAELAQDYPPFVAPVTAARLAARNEDINGQWSDVIPWPHVPVTAANLPDGRILTFSSNQRDAFPSGPEFSYASTWDPASNTFTDMPHESHDMFCGHLSMLEDGRVFINGGRNHVKTTSTFDFRDNSWNRLDDMNRGRWYPTTVAMPNGSVLTAIGSSGGQYPEVWTEGQGWKSLTGASLQSPILDLTSNYENNWWPLLHIDPRGKVFHSGPTENMHVIDPTGLGRVTQVGPQITDWYPKHGTTVMYEEGKLLVAGGAISGNNQASTNKAMIIDINGPSPTITPIEPMAHARKFQNGVMLPNGEVLVVGGNTSGVKFSDAGSVLAPEIWNPDTQQWRTIASMATPRNYHSIALLLADGRVLVGGSGLCGGCATNHRDAEVLSPPYLFNNDGSLADRPSITNAPDVIKYGQPFTLQSDADISKFSLIKMSATTHAVNTDLRFLTVDFQQAGAGLYQLTPHSNKNVLTPGYWMLFAVNDEGVPSEAKIVQVSSAGLPVITQPANQVNTVGDSVLYSIIASDSDSASLLYQATGLPDGLSINTNTGMISGTPTQSGSYAVEIIVSDGEATVSAPFTWDIFPVGSAPGISYEYFEGNWNALPDFSALTPVATGTSDSFDITLRNRDEYFGFRFSARINIETAGNYTFYTNSDDGSQLFIDGNLVVDNDGLHAMQERSGTVNLSAGDHSLIVTFFEKTGGDGLTVQYEGAGISKQLIPSATLRQNPLYNVSPVISDPGNQSSTINQAVTLNISASDLNIEDTLSFSASGLPDGLSINEATGVISGTPGRAASFNSRVTVSDGRGGSQSVSFNWQVVGPINIQAITTSPAEVNTLVTYNAVVTGGSNLRYQWNFGDGTASTPLSTESSVSHPFTTAGTPVVTLIVTGEDGAAEEYQFTQPVHNVLTNNKPAISMSLAYEERSGNDRIWNVNPDNDTVSVFDTVMNAKLAEINVGKAPHALAIAPDGRIWVSNKSDANISVLDADSFSEVQRIILPHASQPHGIAFSPTGSYAYVALEATGEVLKLHPTSGAQIGSVVAGDKVRHISINADGSKLYASRFISPPVPGEATTNPQTTVAGVNYGGEIASINTSDMSLDDKIVLQHSERSDAEHSGRGIPNYLGPLVISPDGLSGWVPSKQDNIKRGMMRDGNPLTHDSTVRSISSRVDLSSESEDYPARVDHDNGGIASSAAYGPYGLYLYVALEGSREVSVIHAMDKSEITRIRVGHAPQGVTVSADGKTLYTHNFMDRSISVHDLSALNSSSQASFVLKSTYNTVASEQLTPTVLLGKQLFYDARDPRLAREQYISCASCHNDGLDDGRVWDLGGFGEGLRNTIELNGRGGMQHGMLHWSANFDEVQDFEGQIRDMAGGLGLLSDSDFHSGTRDTPLGDSKTGVSADLDALAAYVASLTELESSPYQNSDGSLTTDAIAGKRVYEAQQCSSCHSGDNFTDSGPDNLHDIGTIKASSGQRLNGSLTGIDTPTLRGVWSTAPYLHDGSAADLASAVNAHDGISLSGTELDQLVAFLKQIDGDTNNSSRNTNPIDNSVVTLDGALTEWSPGGFFAVDPDDTDGTTNPIDWLKAIISHSDDTLYIGYQNRNAIEAASSSGTSLRWGWQVMIDTDQNPSTGYKQGAIGADYIIEGRHIQKYAGSGSNWSWASIANAQAAYQGNSAELSFPRALIGDPSTIRVVFRGANQAYDGDQIDFYPDDESSYFEYNIPDGTDQSNATPVADAQNVLVSANSSAAVNLTASDADGDSLTYQITTQPANGQLTGTAPNYLYQPNVGFIGNDSFAFVVNDGIIDSAPATVNLTITNDHGGAVFNPSGDTLTLDGSADDWASVTAFESDPQESTSSSNRIDWQSMSMAHDAQFLHVLYRNYHDFSATGESVSYIPWGWQTYLDTDQNSSTGFKVGNIGADFIIEGQAIHRYTGLGTNWNWENIGVAETAANGGPVAEIRFPRSLIGNPDSMRLVVRGINAAVGGSMIDLYPDQQNNVDASTQFFKYEFSSGAYNDGTPTAESQALSTNNDTSLSIVLTGLDDEGDSLTYRVLANPANGTLTGTAPNLTYTANTDYTGNDFFTFVVNDGSRDSAPATVNITVTETSHEAISNPVTGLSIDGNGDDWNSLTRFNDDADDMPLESDTINWQNASMAHSADTLYLLYRNRGLINAASPTGSYIPWGWQTYLDTDSDASTGFRIGDIGADYIVEATSVRRYTGTANSWSWETTVIANVQYANDLAELSFPLTAIANPSAIKLVMKGNNLSVGGSDTDFYPDSAESSGVSGNYFQYSLAQSLARTSARPVALAQEVEVRADATTPITLDASDQDGDSLKFAVIKAPENGSLDVSDETVTYTPDGGFTGDDSFEFVANDGTYDSSVAQVKVMVRNSVTGEGDSSGGSDTTGSGSNTVSSNTESNDSGGGAMHWSLLMMFGLVFIIRRKTAT
ncbi:Ig-like domain-containing protein [Leucothrix pacifica]|uniref:Ig-like domain-containing protein n=1 Tax=Leucothrix pacifica TaxID=1247513 RepID=UPI0011B28BAE|nr:tandem-95 repeat protein [Leucothrix pacifica]